MKSDLARSTHWLQGDIEPYESVCSKDCCTAQDSMCFSNSTSYVPSLSVVSVIQGVLTTSHLMSVSVAGVVFLGCPDIGAEW